MWILQELITQNCVITVKSYVNYTADILQMASKHVWYSVQLYDREYLNFELGTYQQDLTGFQLILKRNTPTPRTIYDASVTNLSKCRRNWETLVLLEGNFLPDFEEIFLNHNSCYSSDYKMAHQCAPCMLNTHFAVSGHSNKWSAYPRKKYCCLKIRFNNWERIYNNKQIL